MAGAFKFKFAVAIVNGRRSQSQWLFRYESVVVVVSKHWRCEAKASGLDPKYRLREG